MEIVDHDPAWPGLYRTEAGRLMRGFAPPLVRIEHIGSTAVPGLAAKPIIDMMASVTALAEAEALAPGLAEAGYAPVPTGMRGRLLYQRRGEPGFNLHIVPEAGFGRRKERLLRDALIADPEAVAEYAALKRLLAVLHADDVAAYTRAKSGFVQMLDDRARDRAGLPRIDVWQDD